MSSLTWPTKGIMISGCGSAPFFLAAMAPSRMARVCISTMPGKTMLRRQPRRPIMGLTSCIPSTLCSSDSLAASSGLFGWVAFRVATSAISVS